MRSSITRLISALHRIVSSLVLFGLSAPVWAAGAGLPWETPLTSIESSISGPVAKVFGVIAVVITGLGVAFGESGTLLRKGFAVVFGLSIAFAAVSFFLGFFGFAGGVTF